MGLRIEYREPAIDDYVQLRRLDKPGDFYPLQQHISPEKEKLIIAVYGTDPLKSEQTIESESDKKCRARILLFNLERLSGELSLIDVNNYQAIKELEEGEEFSLPVKRDPEGEIFEVRFTHESNEEIQPQM